MRVLRVYHAGRDPAHRRREAALVAAGVDVHLVVPSRWSDHGGEATLTETRFAVTELDVTRPGDVNRHRHADPVQVRALLDAVKPDVVDLHEEPFSAVARQWLDAVPAHLPVVMYTAQNLDKRFPPPFHQYERAAFQRVDAFYPCSRQAASVVRGKGFAGRVDVLPLGVDDGLTPGDQVSDDGPFRLALLGRLVPEKGVRDAVRVLAAVHAVTPARLALVGTGPELGPALALAEALGVRDRVDHVGWQPADAVADLYRATHVVLVPSTATTTWVEQFGRVVVEAQAAGAVVAGYASGSLPEVVGRAGVLAPEGDSTALADLVTLLATDRGTWKDLRDDGIAAAATRTWDAVGRRQAELYAAVRETDHTAGWDTSYAERIRAAAHHAVLLKQRVLPRGAAARRASREAARAEFGAPARTPAGERPFALPYLREPNVVSRALARMLDAF